MQFFIPKETSTDETRVSVIPVTISKLVKLGAKICVETGLGTPIHISDDDYLAAGATIATDRKAALSTADAVLRLRKPPLDEIAAMKRGALHVSYLDPFNQHELVHALAAAGVSAVSMEMIPRTTVAQKMDALSSQANLGGYVAVMLAASSSPLVFPMMMTPSGTIRPARVFVIGVGVAGLQAIATAKRLGASVFAFDTRPVVEEQVKSLGAKFVKVDLGETGQTAQGYAKELTAEQLEKQRAAMAEQCAEADIVITTAQVFGRKSPVIMTTAMVEKMRAGSVVVDMAVEGGGNVECSRLGEEVDVRGVKVLGYANLPGRVARTASQMYSNNLGNFVEHFWDKESSSLKVDPKDSLMQGCLITHSGEICHENIRTLLQATPLKS